LGVQKLRLDLPTTRRPLSTLAIHGNNNDMNIIWAQNTQGEYREVS